jgi:hypothetical protein
MSDRDIISLYSQGQQGGELPYFIGKQYGSGWLRTLARLAFPILKRFGKVAVNTAKDVVMNNKEVLPTIKEHAINAASKVIPSLFTQSTKPVKRPNINNTTKRTINKRRRVHKTIFK